MKSMTEEKTDREYSRVDEKKEYGIVDSLLKSPESLVKRLQGDSVGKTAMVLLAATSCGFIVYGLVTGTFSMGNQLWLAALKIWAGALITALMCFPSFYIFACLGHAEINLKQAFAVMFAGLALASVLLIGFMPVALVFSTSTNSVAFMGFFHLVFWFISAAFGMRLIRRLLRLCRAKWSIFIYTWGAIFFITSLQMMTAIRPIIGTSETILPEKKMFFTENWLRSMGLLDEDEHPVGR